MPQVNEWSYTATPIRLRGVDNEKYVWPRFRMGFFFPQIKLRSITWTKLHGLYTLSPLSESHSAWVCDLDEVHPITAHTRRVSSPKLLGGFIWNLVLGHTVLNIARKRFESPGDVVHPPLHWLIVLFPLPSGRWSFVPIDNYVVNCRIILSTAIRFILFFFRCTEPMLCTHTRTLRCGLGISRSRVRGHKKCPPENLKALLQRHMSLGKLAQAITRNISVLEVPDKEFRPAYLIAWLIIFVVFFSVWEKVP